MAAAAMAGEGEQAMRPSLGDLIDWFDGRGPALVAVSGGVDSALVALAAHRSLGDAASAVTADYSTMPRDDLESAGRTCAEIGIRQDVVRYDELADERFARNDRDRCFYCRTELASRLASLAADRGARTVADGTHLDDLGDYRPGIRAMRDGGVSSPLVEAGFAKADVRREAASAGLSAHDRPANSCLASRIPWGRRVTAERLARVEVAESMVRAASGAPGAVRVRDLGGAASIEVECASIGLVSDPAVLGPLSERLRAIGFDSVRVDPEGYAPGRANAERGPAQAPATSAKGGAAP